MNLTRILSQTTYGTGIRLGIVSRQGGEESWGPLLGRFRPNKKRPKGGKDISYEPAEWEVQEPPEVPTRDDESGWDVSLRRCGVLAKKVGMLGMFNEWGEYLPLTLLQVPHCAVVQVKTPDKEGYSAVQVGARQQLARRMTKPAIKHCEKAELPPLLHLKEFLCSPSAAPAAGTRLYAKHFVPGQFVDIQGTTIGKGFQGGMKKWNFGGQNASHGHSLSHRAIGSTGAHQDPGKVWPGKKMPGRMGGQIRTVKNLRVWRVTPGLELIWVIGCVPGHKNAFVRVQDAKNKKLTLVPPFPTWDPEKDPDIGKELTLKMPPPFTNDSWFWKTPAGDERKPVYEMATQFAAEDAALRENDRGYREFRQAEIKSIKPGHLPDWFYEKRLETLAPQLEFEELDQLLSGQMKLYEARKYFYRLTDFLPTGRAPTIRFEEAEVIETQYQQQ